ncbi:MAG: hypothetical protein IJK62_01435 [Bacteroidales bacterium]|nr:hypothetical protein [Bacteroidales bacterium]
MNYESQNIEYKRSGMSVYITRRKGLFGENGPVNDPVNGPVNDGVNDGVKIAGNKNIATDDDHINDHVNDHINDHINDHVNDTVNDGVNDGVKWTRNELRILDEMVH